VRAHGDRDRLVIDRRVRLVAGLVLLEPTLVVIELVWQQRLVVVAVRVERAKLDPPPLPRMPPAMK